MNYKFILTWLILNSGLIFGMESKESSFAGAVKHNEGPKFVVPVVFESQDGKADLLGGQIRGMLGKTSFYRKPAGNRTHEAIIKIADALDQQTKLNEVNAKKDRRNSCLLNCCSTTIALGGLGLSIFSTYWAMTYHQKVS